MPISIGFASISFAIESARKRPVRAIARSPINCPTGTIRSSNSSIAIRFVVSKPRCFDLNPKTREIFLAKRLDGMSYAEISQRTGLSVKGIEKHMNKALKLLDRARDRDRL